MRTLAMIAISAGALLLGACNAANNQGGIGTSSRIPKEPMPGSPAAEMQQQQSAPGGSAPSGVAPR